MSFQNNLQNRFSPQGQGGQMYNSEYNHTVYNNEPKPPFEHSPQPSSTGKHNAGSGSDEPVKRTRSWKKIHEDGESGRRGFHPFHFFHVCWMSSNRVSRMVNVLWPVVPAAIAVVSRTYKRDRVEQGKLMIKSSTLHFLIITC